MVTMHVDLYRCVYSCFVMWLIVLIMWKKEMGKLNLGIKLQYYFNMFQWQRYYLDLGL